MDAALKAVPKKPMLAWWWLKPTIQVVPGYRRPRANHVACCDLEIARLHKPYLNSYGCWDYLSSAPMDSRRGLLIFAATRTPFWMRQCFHCRPKSDDALRCQVCVHWLAINCSGDCRCRSVGHFWVLHVPKKNPPNHWGSMTMLTWMVMAVDHGHLTAAGWQNRDPQEPSHHQ